VIVRVPVAGIDIALQAPTGVEDLLLFEARTQDFGVALALLGRLAARVDGQPIDWDRVAVTDVDVLLLRLRQLLLGDVVRADTTCPGAACGARVDVEFSIGDFLEHHQPRSAARVGAPDADGWFRLRSGAAQFRVPRASDEVAIAREAHPEKALRRLCIRPPDAPPDVRRRAEAAMEAIAPSLCADLEGVCPECGATVACTFDPLEYTLRELRDQAALVYDDVCTIARHLHWSEGEILALPTTRRARYAEMAQHREGRA